MCAGKITLKPTGWRIRPSRAKPFAEKLDPSPSGLKPAKKTKPVSQRFKRCATENEFFSKLFSP
jgi:hypothetical protein